MICVMLCNDNVKNDNINICDLILENKAFWHVNLFTYVWLLKFTCKDDNMLGIKIVIACVIT